MKTGYREWPWSSSSSEEEFRELSSSLPFKGTPIIEASEGTELRLLNRIESLEQLGPRFRASAGGLERILLEVPLRENWRIGVRQHGTVKVCELGLDDLIHENEETLRGLVRSWTSIFDELHEGRDGRPFHWNELWKLLDDLKDGQPDKSVIVRIAEFLESDLADIVGKARRILLRREEEVRLERVRETSRRFLDWYVRSPGETIPEKAGPKRLLPGAVRFESFDTLENRVLRHFIELCAAEGRRYQDAAVTAGYSPEHSRLQLVRRYEKLCRQQLRRDVFRDVQSINGAVSPNYVLQNDPRYRTVWHWYQKLVRREREQDKIWGWQGRVWAEVVRLLIGTVLSGREQATVGFTITEHKNSFVRVTDEQISGRRLTVETFPGPFLVNYKGQLFALDMVDPDPTLMPRFSGFKGLNLSALGGHLYLVLTPFGNPATARPIVLAVWALNCAASKASVSAADIGRSARAALMEWWEENDFLDIHGVVALNSCATLATESTRATYNLVPGGSPHVLTLTVPNRPRYWHSALNQITELIAFFMELVCDSR